MTATLPAYKCGRAEVCQFGDRYFVRMPDGVLIYCGSDKPTTDFLYAANPNRDGAKLRAELIRDAVNCVMKWTNLYPPIGSIEQQVRDSFAGEKRR